MHIWSHKSENKLVPWGWRRVCDVTEGPGEITAHVFYCWSESGTSGTMETRTQHFTLSCSWAGPAGGDPLGLHCHPGNGRNISNISGPTTVELEKGAEWILVLMSICINKRLHWIHRSKEELLFKHKSPEQVSSFLCWTYTSVTDAEDSFIMQ